MKRGFTLIELLVVISIVALLSSVVVASLNSARAKARDATRKSTVGQIYRALQAYHSDYGSYPDSGGGQNRRCLGLGTGQSCAVGSVTHAGANALRDGLAPYMKVPRDPQPQRSSFPEVVDGYLYAQGCHPDWVGGAAEQPCVMWFPETTPTADSCRPGIVGTSASTICGGSCNFCSLKVAN